MENKTYREYQKFNQWWLWLILLGTLLGVSYPMVKAIGEDTFEMSASIVVFYTIYAILLFVFLLMRLETIIDKKGIRFKLFPFVRKKINWSEVKSVKVVNYGFVGGWGIRLFTSFGTVYNIRGNKGLAIELKNGKKLVIGTQQKEKLEHYLREIGA